MAEDLNTPFGDATYGYDELAHALDLLEERALRHQKAPVVPLGKARALQGFSMMQVQAASSEMARASGRRRTVLMAMTTPSFPAELYIEKIRANHHYRRAAAGLERAKRRSGMAFRVVERAVRTQEGGSRPDQVSRLVAATRASLRREDRLADAPRLRPGVGNDSSRHPGEVGVPRVSKW